LAGYPRWKRRTQSTTIPLAAMGDSGKTGWRLVQRSDNRRSWLLHVKGITKVKDRSTWIHCRGWLPHDKQGNPIKITKWRNADLLWRDGHWWISVCIEIEPRREPGPDPVCVEFDLIDATARINGESVLMPDLVRLQTLDQQKQELQSAHDHAWPRSRRLTGDAEAERAASWRVIAKLAAFIARIRRNALHIWTTRIVRRAAELTIIVPPIREHVRTPRGTKRDWGVHVETVSTVNRVVLGQAPAMAVNMFTYKCTEAGVRLDVVTPPAPKIAVGQDLVATGKLVRKMKRVVRRDG
jgi:hypothetical protein